MTYSPVPAESKSQINKVGKVLSSSRVSAKDIISAREVADKWRASHAYPLNTFNAYLRQQVKKFIHPIVAQRLKRMSTIIDKLKRYPNMQLTTMQDIGGIRAILETVDDVYRLKDVYESKSKFEHVLVNEKDYIKNPRDEDGYRSIHLIYKYRSSFAPTYNELLIELQIRTKLQHIWATAVETMGTFLGQALKSRQGDKEWLDFFAITSSAFAQLEKRPLLPRFSHLTGTKTFQEVAVAEARIQALDKMRGFTQALTKISEVKKRGWHYHLITLNSLKGTVEVKPYTKEKFNEAAAEYAKIEAVAEKEKIEPVLVAAGKLKDLRQAYPNFFLDINDFVDKVTEIINMAESKNK